MRFTTHLLAALPLAAAYPEIMEINNLLEKRAYKSPKVPPPAFSSGRDQCGFHGPCVGFSEAQLVDVTAGSGHEFQKPLASDRRGQCPGLNAVANHGFFPRNGILTIADSMC